MNFIATTRAAEGLPRRKFTVAEVLRMVETGLINEDDRLELLGGELVPMSPKEYFHERLKMMLMLHLAAHRPDHVLPISETTFTLSDDTFVEPDILLFPRSCDLRGLRGPDALLVIEIADSSLRFDLRRKPAIYARHGVPELWVIKARSLETIVHRDPRGEVYADVSSFGPSDLLAPARIEGLRLRLDSIGIET